VTASALSTRALRAAVAVAARHGVRCDEPEIMQDASNLLVRLRPAPVVARVSTVTALARDGDAWFAREVAVAGHLAAAGAPVVAPSAEIEPGPHRHDGLVLTFWTYVDEAGRRMDAHEAGRRLRECHDALTTFPGELPRMAVLDEAQDSIELLAAGGALDEGDAALLRRAGEQVRARVAELALPLQALHGDAHLHNVVNGPDGPLWNDFEDTFHGPRAWDLGCLHATARAFGRDPRPVAAAQAGYGDTLDDATLEAFVDARRFQGTVWSVIMAREQPERGERRDELLAHYRALR
jgi:Ser/Thr protein kinase RdoA (MazF antagonist)